MGPLLAFFLSQLGSSLRSVASTCRIQSTNESTVEAVLHSKVIRLRIVGRRAFLKDCNSHIRVCEFGPTEDRKLFRKEVGDRGSALARSDKTLF